MQLLSMIHSLALTKRTIKISGRIYISVSLYYILETRNIHTIRWIPIHFRQGPVFLQGNIKSFHFTLNKH